MPDRRLVFLIFALLSVASAIGMLVIGTMLPPSTPWLPNVFDALANLLVAGVVTLILLRAS
jgi:hypothetical protein